MKLLLDTHLLLWAAGVPQRLPKSARLLLSDDHQLIFSVVSLWEIAIKRGLGRTDFQVEPRRFRRGLLENGYRELVVTSDHAIEAGELPLLHRDPFDRMLVAQARVEGLTLMTADAVLARYGNPVRLI